MAQGTRIRVSGLGLGLGLGLGFRIRFRLKCNYINRGVHTHHYLRVRVSVTLWHVSH